MTNANIWTMTWLEPHVSAIIVQLCCDSMADANMVWTITPVQSHVSAIIVQLHCDSMTDANMVWTTTSVQSHVSAICLILLACAVATFRANRISEIADTWDCTEVVVYTMFASVVEYTHCTVMSYFYCWLFTHACGCAGRLWTQMSHSTMSDIQVHM